MDVYPCVTDEEDWTPEISIEGLFGHVCTGTIFSHDREMQLIHDISIVHNSKSSPRQTSCERGESGTPTSSPFDPRSGCGPRSGQSALRQPSPAIDEVSNENMDIVLSNKRRGTTDINNPSECRAKLRVISREPSERRDGDSLARSFSGWLDGQGREIKPIKPTMSETIDRENRNTRKREGNTSPWTARSRLEVGDLGTSPIDSTGQLQQQSILLDVGDQRSIQNDAASSRPSSRDETNTCKKKPHISGTGTQCDPVALSDTSEFVMDTEDDDETCLRASVSERHDPGSRSGSPVSLPDSLFDSSPSDSHTVKSTDPRRIQYRKEIYRAVERDDGHIWGREYSLVSTNTRHGRDELEL
ncbi:MAG: hypothetical protein Q9221_004526 [Calogaya cf. arnoldii]